MLFNIKQKYIKNYYINIILLLLFGISSSDKILILLE